MTATHPATRTRAEARVLSALDRPATAADLCDRTGLAWTTVVRALRLLREAGEIEFRGGMWRTTT